MRVLCVCGYGHNRSVAAAYILSHDYGHETLAMGVRHGLDTRTLLQEWAECIVLMEPHYLRYIPPHLHKKVSVCDVGHDVYGTPTNPELVARIRGWVQHHDTACRLRVATR